VARRLVTDAGWQVVFTGTPPERALVEGIRDAMGAPSYSLAGDVGLNDLVALISLAPLLLSNNTGPVHIAAAVGTPVVDLYALTNPQHMPWAVPSRVLSHDVPCKWCYQSVCPERHNNCLTLVTPESVVRAVTELYEATAGRLAATRRPGDRTRQQPVGAW
jgi:ADP-heptose:LPS heptosyltransferase